MEIPLPKQDWALLEIWNKEENSGRCPQIHHFTPNNPGSVTYSMGTV